MPNRKLTWAAIGVVAILAAVTAFVTGLVDPLIGAVGHSIFGEDDVDVRVVSVLGVAGNRDVYYETAPSDGTVVASAHGTGNRVYVYKMAGACDSDADRTVGELTSPNGGALIVRVERGQCWQARVLAGDSATVFWINR